MTEQEIIDNNRIIAEFMGAKPCKQHPNTQLFLTIKDNKNPSLQYLKMKLKLCVIHLMLELILI